MIVNKVTTGFVVQKFDTDTRAFVSQEFVAGDQVDFEYQDGEAVESFDNYLPFDMVQPVEDAPTERLAAVERFLSKPSDEEWAKLRNVILSDHPLRVIVTIEGGNYQGAVATGPIDLSVLDIDNWEACDEAHNDEAEYYAKLETEVERLQADPTATLL
jgi:hypothetical protein